jgi:hypothetical protein
VAAESACWEPYSRNGLAEDRWAYFAKLINIVVYEVVANRELFSETDWQRLRPFLHIPVDASITYHLSQLETSFPGVWVLKGMTKDQYVSVQDAVRPVRPFQPAVIHKSFAVHPEFSGRMEEGRETYRSIPGNATLAFDDRRDSIGRHFEGFRNGIRIDRRFSRFHEFFQENLTWMHGSHAVLDHVTLSLGGSR